MTHALITGAPGVGKTTLVVKLAETLASWEPVGFYTEEIRESGVRKGFELVSFSDDQRQILAHVGLASTYRVGKYGVDIPAFERFLDAIALPNAEARVVIIDEIGKMECHSEKFQRLLLQLLESERIVIATVALKGPGIISDVKKRSDVQLFSLTAGNRVSVLSQIVAAVPKGEK